MPRIQKTGIQSENEVRHRPRGRGFPIRSVRNDSSGGKDYNEGSSDFLTEELVTQKKVKKKPWYMEEGVEFPIPEDEKNSKLFPEDYVGHDRIPEQLMYLARGKKNESRKYKKILLWNGVNYWGSRPGRGIFLKEKCPVSECVLTSMRSEFLRADLVIFKDHFVMPSFNRPPNQLWMMYMLECPLHTQNFKQKDVFNWTSTYRSDSTIVAPYERWQYYDEDIKAKPHLKDYTANKTKGVAWFVSNCGARNGRLKYARELQKFIQVDIYGSCGSLQCPRSNSQSCFKMLDKDYKFYLAFENSNCKDYITEKFFVNGLSHDVVPIVMGARKEDYERSAPYKSFIHVDDFEGPEELAKYLHKLDQNDDLYNEYFEWKSTGEFVNTKFFCRVCALLNSPKSLDRDSKDSWYPDINEWWRGKGTCINGSWKKFEKAIAKFKSLKTSSPSSSSTSSLASITSTSSSKSKNNNSTLKITSIGSTHSTSKKSSSS
ncbi:E2.4.1.214 [Lepeophtheirus salmonis]|uniref:Fucosyltransferase n=1 Tax=Lepeophtheirus salmonis TaxID=72036 RepID=A0A7R8H8P9_LEPSM|nr:E2.4.1.214 [Lepeophtheirus salmonis]CAF2942425.1 E2.4.1.214 [Lepeophtheirus salmonis]